MYIPLSFMGGTGIVATCNCNYLDFELIITAGKYIDLTYQPCNGEQIQTIRYTSTITSNQQICVGDRNYNFSGTGVVNNANIDRVCLEANCQSCGCYEFFYQISIDAPTYISYVPCNVPSSSREIIGPFAPLSTGSFVCSFPWTVIPISGNLDYPTNGPTGVIKLVNSGSCQSNLVSGSVQVGDLRGGGQVVFVTGSYPNQNGLIATTQSIATSSANFSRWGFYGTITGINNQAYGSGYSNTVALRNYIPATGSIAANALTASINGYNDWFLPSQNEAYSASLNWIQWPVQWSATPGLTIQPQLWKTMKGNNTILTSTEKYDGTTAQRQQFARGVDPLNPGSFADINKNNQVSPINAFRYFTSSLVV